MLFILCTIMRQEVKECNFLFFLRKANFFSLSLLVLSCKIKTWVAHQSAMILDKTCTVSTYDLSASVTETPGAGKMATSSSESSRASWPRGLTLLLHEDCEVRSSRSHTLHKPEWRTSMTNPILKTSLTFHYTRYLRLLFLVTKSVRN